MDTQRILVERGSAARVTLNRPEIHNAFDEAMISDLTTAFRSLSSDSAIRAIVLTGAGASFSAGADLDWMRRMAAYSREENLADAHALGDLFRTIWECPKVTVARVNGAALGGGAGLAAVCDVAVAADSAKFGFTEVRLGLAPAVISPYVVRKVGDGSARALFLTGDRIPASEALRIGLVNRVAPLDALDSAVSEVTDSVMRSGPNAIAETKRLLREIEGTPESAALTEACIADLRAHEEGQEGIRAFLEKRTPAFSVDGRRQC
jgi:methylglutaconyl-CoA hydratase